MVFILLLAGSGIPSSGLVRYLYLIQRRSLGESPEDVFLSDVPLIISILLWLATAASVLLFYGT